jgi:hypothetical protein
MSDELTALEESITKFLLDLMTERVISERRMSTGVQASSTRGVKAIIYLAISTLLCDS